MSNIVTAAFGSGCGYTTTENLWQYDYGQILQITGLDLPDAYQVHFCNKGDLTTIEMIGDAGGVTIPDNLLENGAPINAYIYLHTGTDDGETEYKITIPVNQRPEPSDEQPTPAQQSAIDQAIAALNSGVSEAGSHAEDAAASAQEAADSATAAADSATEAQEAADRAAETAVTPEEVQQIVVDYLEENPPAVEETDPTVPAWAKAQNPPTPAEIGAATETALANEVTRATGAETALGTRIDNLTTTVNGKANQSALTAEVNRAEAAENALDGRVDALEGEMPLKATQAALTAEISRAEAAEAAKLPLAGGTMTGNINMGAHKLTNVADGTADGDAVNKGQLDAAVSGIGTVFTLKGSVLNYSSLPSTGNTIGDVWYVEEDQTVSGVFYPGQAGYIWLEDSNNVLRWEELGQTIDTDLFLTKTGLATGTGGATDNAMTQAAVTAAVNAKYTKPSAGIPKTDLASAVQTSLEKADSAYQKPSAGIPKTDLVPAVQTSLGKADTAYQKPSTGIPATDLASAVQTSLGLADTALQSVPSTYRTAAAQDAIDAGKITAPASATAGQFLVYNGTTWAATTVPSASGVSF